MYVSLNHLRFLLFEICFCMADIDDSVVSEPCEGICMNLIEAIHVPSRLGLKEME